MRALSVVIFVLMIMSCRHKESILFYYVSGTGSINSIREFEGKIYALNSSRSQILLLENDGISVFKDINIGGRDFLQDFFIRDGMIFYSNTYDEIFTAAENAIEDTVRIENPGRIAVAGEYLFVTSRIREGKYFHLRSFCLKGQGINAEVRLNSGSGKDPAFSKVWMKISNGDLWLYNPFRNKIGQYDRSLNIRSFFELDHQYSYGAFTVGEMEVVILAEKDDEIYLCKIDRVSKAVSFEKLPVPKGNYDINASGVTDRSAYLYDYIKGKILVVPTGDF